MKNVDIFNFWWVSNYGALLTAYALQSLVNKLGYNPLLINNSYRHNELISENFAKNFEQFYLKTSNKVSLYSDLNCLNQKSNIFITGSDQILRPTAARERLSQYLQDFVSINSKKITMAASFAVDKKTLLEETNSQILENMKISLKSFDFISVREKSGVEICKDLFDVDAEWIIDPVFIMNKSNYDALIKNSTKDFSYKIVSYVLDPNKEYEKAYKYLEKKYNKKILKTAYSDISVEDWLASIKNCEFLITDSFHGMCFAIIFNKPFICITNPKRGATRFESILEMLKIENQCIDNIDATYEKDCIFKINYEKVNQRIEEEAQKGLDFLKRALEAPVGKKEEKIEAKIHFLENKIYELEQQANSKYQVKEELWNLWLIIFHKYLPKPIKIIIRFARDFVNGDKQY